MRSTHQMADRDFGVCIAGRRGDASCKSDAHILFLSPAWSHSHCLSACANCTSTRKDVDPPQWKLLESTGNLLQICTMRLLAVLYGRAYCTVRGQNFLKRVGHLLVQHRGMGGQTRSFTIRAVCHSSTDVPRCKPYQLHGACSLNPDRQLAPEQGEYGQACS
jgi:hypothetical protein